MPTVIPVSVDGVNNGSIEAVTTAKAAAGDTVLTFASTAGIQVYSFLWGLGLQVPNPDIGVWVTALSATTVTLNQAISADLPIGTRIFFNPDAETTQDICIAAKAAPGANIAVFFSSFDQKGWVDLINRVVFPNPGDPVCSVLSSSWYIADGDDLATLTNEGVSPAMVDAISNAFHDAAILGHTTICIASGDTGSNSYAGKYPIFSTDPLTYGGDGKAHVQYPASDPWVLSVGGTTVGNIVQLPPSFDEYVWNDPDPSDPSQWGTTGGGVSDRFRLPSYQVHAGVPKSVNDNHVGRGVPDVAGNASINSGYSGLFIIGLPFIGNGTSASAPHWAGLIAVINAALGEPVGFLNPSIYEFGSSVFRDIKPPPGPTNNSNSGISGYPAGQGWDACTGWGSPNGVALLTALQALPEVYIRGGYDSQDIFLTDLRTGNPIPLGDSFGGKLGPKLKTNTDYGLSARVHNHSNNTARDVVVKFWIIPGGERARGRLISTPKTVTVRPNSSTVVTTKVRFTARPPPAHTSVAASIYNPATGCRVDARTALQIPDPGLSNTHACSAWRKCQIVA
jgi:hypothetical protein